MVPRMVRGLGGAMLCLPSFTTYGGVHQSLLTPNPFLPACLRAQYLS
jgi:hypothetical protein